jgi:hypothetical protein
MIVENEYININKRNRKHAESMQKNAKHFFSSAYINNGSMTSPHKKSRKPHKKKVHKNAMTTSHDYGMSSIKCDQNT